jgi:hypothetical protein
VNEIPDIREKEGTVRKDHEYVYKILREIKRLAKQDEEQNMQSDQAKEAA